MIPRIQQSGHLADNHITDLRDGAGLSRKLIFLFLVAFHGSAGCGYQCKCHNLF